MNKEKLSKILWGIFAAAMVGVFAYSMLTGSVEHIEDFNGENNTAIATITDAEIIDYYSKGSIGIAREKSDFEIAGWQLGGIKFSSNKFSGVEPLLQTDILFTTGFDLNIYNYKVHEGNFRLYVLNEDEIIDILEPSEEYTHHYEDFKGKFTVVAVGESADFEFEMSTAEYNEYYHFNFE